MRQRNITVTPKGLRTKRDECLKPLVLRLYSVQVQEPELQHEISKRKQKPQELITSVYY